MTSTDTSGNEVAVIETTLGDIELELQNDIAPGHVKNFKDLANQGFYDGTTFHRVIPGFMIQGGDPNSKSDDRSMHGTGGPGYTIKAEFSSTPHNRGVLSMARSQDPDSAGCQFFIVVKDSSFLDNQYTIYNFRPHSQHPLTTKMLYMIYHCTNTFQHISIYPSLDWKLLMKFQH